MAKYIKKIKAKSNNYNILLTANISHKKLQKSIKKSLSNLPLDTIIVSLDGKSDNTNKRQIIGTILLVTGIISLIFAYINFKKDTIVPQCILPQSKSTIITQEIVVTPTPIKKDINISIVNATYQNLLATNLKFVLNQNKFEKVSVANSRQKLNTTTIEYRPEHEAVAKYIQENYRSLIFSNLVANPKMSPKNDLIITIGKSYLTK